MNIAPPGVRARSAYAGVVFTAFLQGRRNMFFPSLFLLFSPFSSMFSAFSIDILSRVRINCYLIITRDYYFSFLFLFQRAKRNLPSFPGGRLTLERVGISKGSVRTPFHLLVGVLSRNHDLSRHVYMAGIARGVAASYRGQGFLGIRGNTSRGG